MKTVTQTQVVRQRAADREELQETEILRVIHSVKEGAVGTTGTLIPSSVFWASG